ncbi:MAG: hypothetical protein WC582_04260 [Patescibacteria group bacterium]|jgi:hypothetical protein
MNECENSHRWKPTSSFLSIKRCVKDNDIFSKNSLFYSLTILLLYAFHLFIGLKLGWDMFSLKEFIEAVMFSITAIIAFLFFFRLSEKREKFLTGIKIHGAEELDELEDFGAIFVDSGEETDYEINKFGDEYRVFENPGNQLIFSIQIDFYKHDTEIIAIAIATAIYTLKKQYD